MRLKASLLGRMLPVCACFRHSPLVACGGSSAQLWIQDHPRRLPHLRRPARSGRLKGNRRQCADRAELERERRRATSYVLERGTTSGGPYTQIGTATSVSYTDTGVTNGTAYYYVVIAVNSAGQSARSTEVSATPDSMTTVPPVPAGLTASAGNAQVGLTWTLSAGASSYHVKRATVSGGPFTVIATPTPASYTDMGLTNGTTYFYVVSALDSAGESRK